MIKYYLILILMTVIGSAASFFLKRASKSETILSLIKNFNIYVGGGLYVTSALLNIYILKYLEYSIVLPLTAITYIWTLFISYKFLDEKITKKKVFGVISIIIGAIIITL